jgi:hypothetical protein
MERAARSGAAMNQDAQVCSAHALEACRSGTPKAAIVRGDANTRPAAVAGPDPDELTARVFRALYHAYDLHPVEGLHVVIPRGTAAPGRHRAQISNHEQRQARREQ